MAADEIYSQLVFAGVEVLYDDRDERAGVKFNDADLLGIPIRITVGSRGLKSGLLEVKLRRNGESSELPLDNIAESVQKLIAAEIGLVERRVREETVRTA